MIKSVSLVYTRPGLICKIIELNADLKHVWVSDCDKTTIEAFRTSNNPDRALTEMQLKMLIGDLRMICGTEDNIRDIGHCLIGHGGYGMGWAVIHQFQSCDRVSVAVEELQSWEMDHVSSMLRARGLAKSCEEVYDDCVKRIGLRLDVRHE